MLSSINQMDGRVSRPAARSSLFDGAGIPRILQMPFAVALLIFVSLGIGACDFMATSVVVEKAAV